MLFLFQTLNWCLYPLSPPDRSLKSARISPSLRQQACYHSGCSCCSASRSSRKRARAVNPATDPPLATRAPAWTSTSAQLTTAAAVKYVTTSTEGSTALAVTATASLTRRPALTLMNATTTREDATSSARTRQAASDAVAIPDTSYPTTDVLAQTLTSVRGTMEAVNKTARIPLAASSVPATAATSSERQPPAMTSMSAGGRGRGPTTASRSAPTLRAVSRAVVVWATV